MKLSRIAPHIRLFPNTFPNQNADHRNGRKVIVLKKACLAAIAGAACLVFPALANAQDSGGSFIRASYYSSGSRTASGERFNPNGFTAAHRTLPFGTRLQVTNPRTGRSVVVRVNDRGPFVHGRSLDLARGAAAALGMIGTGTASLVIARL